MQNLTEVYRRIYLRLEEIRKKQQELARNREETAERLSRAQNDIRSRYAQLRQELEEQLHQLRIYESIARNALLEFPPEIPPRKPSFSSLEQLMLQIDQDEIGTEAAEILWTASRSGAAYVQQELQKLSGREAAELAAMNRGNLSPDAPVLRQMYEELFAGPELAELASGIAREMNPYYVDKRKTYHLTPVFRASAALKLGVIQYPLRVPEEFEPKLKTLFGTYYDPKTRTVRLPFGFQTAGSIKVLAEHPAELSESCQNAMGGLMFNVLRHYPAMAGRIVCLDPGTCNPEHLGVLRQFTGRFGPIIFPENEEQMQSALDRLIRDSSDPAGKRESRFLILRNYPEAFGENARKKIRRICNNTSYYHISVIATRLCGEKDRLPPADLAAFQDAVRILGDSQRFRIVTGRSSRPFSWFTVPRSLTSVSVLRFRDACAPRLLGSEYPARVALDQQPRLKKGTRMLSVPFGIDEEDRLQNLDFNETNFAMYLMGAAGSGKSTLLHTIITGLIRNYHPDDVELWLADFKMNEFAQYIRPIPPHVKYVLLDESPELIYDFVELLTEKLREREVYFSRHSDLKNFTALGADVYMPAIVVIIDEFSIMSQALEESPEHRTLLQNLLTKGRALGFKFIFSSQDYSNGIRGLTPTAKNQIQSRIAMMSNSMEIRDVLNLSPSMVDDRLREWIDALPPHQAIYRYYREDLKRSELIRSQVLFFPDGSDWAYKPQRQMIERQLSRLHPVSANQYSASDEACYVSKHPVVADGNGYQAFTASGVRSSFARYEKTNPGKLFPEDLMLCLGSPRRLLPSDVQVLLNEVRENLLLVTGEEAACSASVVLSAARSVELGGGTAQIWAYRRSREYSLLRGSISGGTKVFDTPEEIADAMLELRSLVREKRQGRALIVLLGMDKVLEDLEYLESDTPAEAFGPDDHDPEKMDRLQQEREKYQAELERIQDEGLESGKSPSEIRAECEAAYRRMKGLSGKPAAPVQRTAVRQKEDYRVILEELTKRGSRFGYHFLLCVRNFGELRNTGLSMSAFAHRISFRISTDDSSVLFGNRHAATLKRHTFRYSNDYTCGSFRPFLHPGLSWDNWTVDRNGTVIQK